VEARDRAGNVSVAQVPVWLVDGGLPEARITAVHIWPRQLVIGGPVHIEVGVRNVGRTVLRTQGPGPGYDYTSYESFGSIADGAFIDRAGLWRVGIDWQGVPVTTESRFPYRWGFGQDLGPGEEVRVSGTITLLHRIAKLWVYAALVQEGHGYFDAGQGRTLVEVSF
jgi:hypothetical protein